MRIDAASPTTAAEPLSVLVRRRTSKPTQGQAGRETVRARDGGESSGRRRCGDESRVALASAHSGTGGASANRCRRAFPRRRRRDNAWRRHCTRAPHVDASTQAFARNRSTTSFALLRSSHGCLRRHRRFDPPSGGRRGHQPGRVQGAAVVRGVRRGRDREHRRVQQRFEQRLQQRLEQRFEQRKQQLPRPPRRPTIAPTTRSVRRHGRRGRAPRAASLGGPEFSCPPTASAKTAAPTDGAPAAPVARAAYLQRMRDGQRLRRGRVVRLPRQPIGLVRNSCMPGNRCVDSDCGSGVTARRRMAGRATAAS